MATPTTSEVSEEQRVRARGIVRTDASCEHLETCGCLEEAVAQALAQEAQRAEGLAKELVALRARVGELEPLAGKAALCEVKQHRSRIELGTEDNERLRRERVEALRARDAATARVAELEKQLAGVQAEREAGYRNAGDWAFEQGVQRARADKAEARVEALEKQLADARAEGERQHDLYVNAAEDADRLKRDLGKLREQGLYVAGRLDGREEAAVVVDEEEEGPHGMGYELGDVADFRKRCVTAIRALPAPSAPGVK